MSSRAATAPFPKRGAPQGEAGDEDAPQRPRRARLRRPEEGAQGGRGDGGRDDGERDAAQRPPRRHGRLGRELGQRPPLTLPATCLFSAEGCGDGSRLCYNPYSGGEP